MKTNKVKYNWENKVILIVEDTLSSNLYFEAALAPTKTKLLSAKTSEEAIEIVKNNHVDLVLMDLKLPVGDGYEATKEIKKLKKEISVIVQTAYVLSNEREKSFEAGCDEFIAKPVNLNLLLSTIETFFIAIK